MYDNGYGIDPYGYQPPLHKEISKGAAHGFLRTVLSVLVLVVLVVLLSWGLRTFVFQAYEIPSGSMEETIMPGDMVFSEKITYYGSDPAPGDIVTFQDPDPEQGGRILIKRVHRRGRPDRRPRATAASYVDGVLQDEPYTRGEPSYPLTPYYGLSHRLPLHGARRRPVGHGGQPHQFPGFPLLRRHHRSSDASRGKADNSMLDSARWTERRPDCNSSTRRPMATRPSLPQNGRGSAGARRPPSKTSS